MANLEVIGSKTSSLPTDHTIRFLVETFFEHRCVQGGVTVVTPSCTGAPRSCEPPPPKDPTVALRLGTYGDPGGGGGFLTGEVPLYKENSEHLALPQVG